MSRRGSRASHAVARLLNLVPYLQSRPGVRIAEAAADLGVSEDQLRDDLALLWVCGLPGYGPGDLIDMAFHGDRVTLTYDAGIDRPLRLTPDEALALVVALRMLAETPGVAHPDAVGRALSKIEAAAGADSPVAVRLPGNPERLAAAREAVASGRAWQITYYAATRDRTSERVIDPLRVVVVGGHGYLEAWCRRAAAVRRFRADRIDAMTVLDEPAAPPPRMPTAVGDSGIFQPGQGLPLVTLRVGRRARWITEYYPCEQVEESIDGWVVSLRATDMAWARRLVLGLGPDVTVIGPAELAESVRDHATAALEAYAAPCGLGSPQEQTHAGDAR